MSYKNELTPQQLRNFRRRARFTVCGEPCDVFAGPTDPENPAARDDVMFVTVNRNSRAAWLEATSYTYNDPTDEIRPDYLKLCRKVDEQTARRVIARELYRWASMRFGTVSGYTPEDIAAEADRIANG